MRSSVRPSVRKSASPRRGSLNAEPTDSLWPTRAKQVVLNEIRESARTKKLLERNADEIVAFASMVSKCIREGHKLVLFGNGGSAADAQHIAAEFAGRYLRERGPLPSIALTVNTSTLTAIANDFGFQQTFSRQVESICVPGDLVVAISTSGNSENVILGVRAARRIGAATVALTGASGGRVAGEVDLAIRVPSVSTPRIQECHILLGHIVSNLAEQSLVVREGMSSSGESSGHISSPFG